MRFRKLVNTNQGGFTLIELLLVVGLLAISVGVTSDILLSLIRSYTKSQVINEIEQSANFVSLKLEKELRNASRIDKIGTTAPPVTNTTGNSIVFTTHDGSIISYELNASTNRFRRGTCTTISNCTFSNGELTPASTSIGTVAVSCPSSCFKLIEDIPQVININIQFQQGGTANSKVFTGNTIIDNTIVVRNTY